MATDEPAQSKRQETAQGCIGLVVILVIAGIISGVCAFSGDSQEPVRVDTTPPSPDDELEPDAYLWMSEYAGIWGDCQTMINRVLASTQPTQQVKQDAFFAEGCVLLLLDIIDKAPSDCWGEAACREIKAIRPDLVYMRETLRELQE